MDGALTFTLGQAITTASALLAGGGIIYQVKNLGNRVGSLEDKITNGMSEKLAVTSNSNIELRSEVDEMWKIINFHKKSEELAAMDVRQVELQRRVKALEEVKL